MKQSIIYKFMFIMVVMGIVIIFIQAYSLRHIGMKQSVDEAKQISEIIKNGLTSHMVNKTMHKKKYFLESLSQNTHMRDIWVIRGSKVIDQFGISPDTQVKDDIDRKALLDGKTQTQLTESLTTAKLRVTVPYKAIQNSNTNCMECHNVEYGATLGAVSIIMDITDYKNYGLNITIVITLVTLFSIIVLLYMLNRILNPYVKTLSILNKKIDLASQGIFEKIPKDSKAYKDFPDESKKIIKEYNYLVNSLNSIFLKIDNKLRSFIGENPIEDKNRNLLEDSANIVRKLSYIFEFKKQLQLDKTKDEVYLRIGSILKNQFDITDINITEIDENNKVTKIYEHGDNDFCFQSIKSNPQDCRVFKNASDVYSVKHQKACNCFNSDKYLHYCIDIEMGENSKIIFNFIFLDRSAFDNFRTNLSFIKSYLDEIAPTISFMSLFEKLQDIAVKDGLTGLYNRRYLDDYVQTLLPIAKREGFNIGFLMLDMDYFKAVNDEYGHDIGDKVLIELAKTIQKNVRESDIVIRFGGEEFIVLLVNIKTEEDVINIANKIKEDVAQTEIEVYAGSTIKKTVSIGVSMFPEDSIVFNNIMKNADIALYEAKELGRNKIVRYKENIEDNVELF